MVSGDAPGESVLKDRRSWRLMPPAKAAAADELSDLVTWRI